LIIVKVKFPYSYNDAIKLAREVGYQGTVDLLTKILKMEEDHVDWAEVQRAQIDQMELMPRSNEIKVISPKTLLI